MSKIQRINRRPPSKIALLRAMLLVLPACYLDRVDGWCLLSTNYYEENGARSSFSFASCSVRPTFLPSSSSSTTTTSRTRRRSSVVLGETARRRRRRRPGRQSPYDDDEGFLQDEDFEHDDDDDDDDDVAEIRSGARSTRQPQRRPRRSDYDYSYDDDEDDPYAKSYSDDDYEEDHDERGEDSGERDNYVSRPRPVEWEEVQVPNMRNAWDYEDEDSSPGSSTAYVLLPPSPPTMHPLPSAVLHFVGGTVFGSAPKAFYRSLLEDIVTHTQCAIVITPLPVITPLNSRQTRGPLHHVQMAKNLQHQFQFAYEQVLDDEYGSQAMKDVPIAGLGHSLGSRLLVVLATLMKDDSSSNAAAATNEEETSDKDSKNGRQRRRRREKDDAPSYHYKSMILISFTNFGAAAGIPGVTSLLKQRRQIDEKNGQRPRRPRTNNSPRAEEPKRQQQRRRRPSRRDGDLYDEDDDDEDLMEEWSELWEGFQGVFQDQADRVKTKLTPQPEDLEFYPTPRQLWTAVEGDAEKGQESKYRIRETLLVQFDRDDMDQSAKLATAVVASGRNSKAMAEAAAAAPSNSTSLEDDDYVGTATATASSSTAATPVTDLKFARLRGTHLTPVSTSNSQFDDTMINGYSSPNSKGLLREWSSKSTKAVWNAIQGRVVGGKAEGGNMSQDEALRDLRQTITRYIADVVTK